MIRTRKECPEISWGQFEVVKSGAKEVLVVRYDWRGTSLATVHNFSDRKMKVTVDINCPRGETLVDIYRGDLQRARKGCEHQIELPPYAWRWYRVGSADNALDR
jgi:maltose alpha-D-glucosyltransferase/alpha-amylase